LKRVVAAARNIGATPFTFFPRRPGVGHPTDAPRCGAGGENMLDNPAERLWHRVVFPQEFDADYEERILAEARSIAQRRLNRLAFLESPRDTRKLIMQRFLGNPEELFAGIFLDNRHRVIACEILSRGSISECPVHPRVIARRALSHNAGAVILAHNHPSGFCEPSEADRHITREIKDALSLVEVRLLDHFVVGGMNAVSMAEEGLI